MDVLSPPVRRRTPTLKPDPERALVLSLVERMQVAEAIFDPIHLINLYVSLKAKPLAILIGPGNSGKLTTVQILANQLIGRSEQLQMMVGHPFWASKSPNVALFTEAQARFNTEKVLCLMEEAGEPKNAQRLYIACLARISQAELETYFASAAFQLGHGELMALPYAHFNEPVPFPRNLLLIGTMDSVPVTRFSSTLLSQASLIHWPENGTPLVKHGPDRVPARRQAEFLRQSIRTIRPARYKLSRILGWGLRGLDPVKEIFNCLEEGGSRLPSHVSDQVLIYLANAWSRDDVGLFSMSNAENLAVALDFAVAQYLLPHLLMVEDMPEASLQHLAGILQEQFPHASSTYPFYRGHLREGRVVEKGIDPVCGMEVAPAHAAGTTEVNGQHYHFCAAICKQAFDASPSRYIGR